MTDDLAVFFFADNAPARSASTSVTQFANTANIFGIVFS